MAVVTIENFPPEVLELIFKELNLKDTGNCSLTCLKWQRLIAALYKDKCKLILVNSCSETSTHLIMYPSKNIYIDSRTLMIF